MEKYLRGLDDETTNVEIIANNNNNCDLTVNNNPVIDIDVSAEANKKPELSKWLESTANFTPSNYNIDFVKDKRKFNKNNASLCEKELLAAETLVLLKNNFRTKFYNS